MHALTLRLTCPAGTLFVLVKRPETAVDALLVAARDGDDARVHALIDTLKGTSAVKEPAKDDVILGKWRLLWSQQAENANPLQKALAGQVCMRPSAAWSKCPRDAWTQDCTAAWEALAWRGRAALLSFCGGGGGAAMCIDSGAVCSATV